MRSAITQSTPIVPAGNDFKMKKPMRPAARTTKVSRQNGIIQ